MGAPALSGFCNPGNPWDSHTRCTLEGCTCSHHQLRAVPDVPATDPVAALQTAVEGLEGTLPALVEACTDPQATDLATLLYDVQAARIKLQELERDLEAQTAKAMLSDEVHTDTLRVERRRARDRKSWDHEAWRKDVSTKLLRKLGLLGAQAIVTKDGEPVEAAGVLHTLLAEAYSAQGSHPPRTGGLRALGLEPEDYCETTKGAWTVRVQRVADERQGE